MFPEIGVPPVIIHFNGIFPYKPTIFGDPPLWKPPYESKHEIPYRWCLWELHLLMDKDPLAIEDEFAIETWPLNS